MKTSTFTVPSDLDTAKTSLAEIGGLINAKKWQRAAIVAAFVTLPGSGGDRTRANVNTDICSTTDFAAFGITGLASHVTVKRYVETWLAERPRPRPGERVDLTGLPEWPAAGQTGGRPRDSKASDAATIIERRGADEVVQNLTTQQRNDMAAALRRQEQAEAEAEADRIAQNQLDTGLHDRENAALRDMNKARLMLHQPLIEASYTVVEVSQAWPEWHGFLSQADRETLPEILIEMQGRIAELQLLITDDIVGEVLNHGEGR